MSAESRATQPDLTTYFRTTSGDVNFIHRQHGVGPECETCSINVLNITPNQDEPPVECGGMEDQRARVLVDQHITPATAKQVEIATNGCIRSGDILHQPVLQKGNIYHSD